MGQTALELLGFSDKGERKMNCFLSVWLFFPSPSSSYKELFSSTPAVEEAGPLGASRQLVRLIKSLVILVFFIKWKWKKKVNRIQRGRAVNKINISDKLICVDRGWI